MKLFAESDAWQEMIRLSKTRARMFKLDKLILSTDPKLHRAGAEMAVVMMQRVSGLTTDDMLTTPRAMRIVESSILSICMYSIGKVETLEEKFK
jgi:hypothetical protein